MRPMPRHLAPPDDGPPAGARGERACRRLPDGTAVYVVGESEGRVRLDLFLRARIPKMSRRRLQEAIPARVESPGHGRIKPSTVLRPGDTVVVRPAPPPVEPDPEVALPVLHLDDDLIVVDKPAGLLVHPSNHVRKSSVTWMLSREPGGPIHLVHRLDRETSGLLAVARGAAAARALSAQMAPDRTGPARPAWPPASCGPRAASKSYQAIVFGELRITEGCIDLPIGRAVRSAVYVKRGVNHDDGRPSRTWFRVEARGGGFSLVRARLETGRRHQIRVHLAAAGHPVVGDKLYGPAESHYLRFIRRGFDDRMRRGLLAERHLLHASDLSLLHPRDGSSLAFTAPLPADMREFLDRAGVA